MTVSCLSARGCKTPQRTRGRDEPERVRHRRPTHSLISQQKRTTPPPQQRMHTVHGLPLVEKGGGIYPQPFGDILHVAICGTKIETEPQFVRLYGKKTLTCPLSKCPIFFEQLLKPCFTAHQAIGHMRKKRGRFSDVTL